MNDAVPTFRVSQRYLWNLVQQGSFGAVGALLGWALFLAVTLPIRSAWEPIILGSPDETRELIRFGFGPGLAICFLLGALADLSSWMAVRYEIHPDRLRMCWRKLSRDVAWDLILTVEQRPHADACRCSLLIAQNDAGPILVGGHMRMPAGAAC